MKKVVFFSGGMGSFTTAYRVFDSDTHLLFTDTLIEHRTLYKFLVESFEYFFDIDLQYAHYLVDTLPEVYEDMDKRKRILLVLQTYINGVCPRVHWIRYEVDGVGVSPWDIFYNNRFIGNSRVANCSKIIKQRLARTYVKGTFENKTYDVFLGIDWSESHRVKAPTDNWGIYANEVKFPLLDPPYIVKEDKISLLKDCGIEVPELYKLGMEHNNCGGFCVRAGQGHFAKLLEVDEKVFDYHAGLEEEMRGKLGKDVSILKKQRNGTVSTYPLTQLKAEVLSGGDVDRMDIGGCGCFVTDDGDEEYLNGDRWTSKDLKVVTGYV